MYNFFHILRTKIEKKINLLMTDTDSLILEIYTNDIYKDLKKISHLLDFSNYPKDHFLYDIEKRLIPGFFKDEFPPSENSENIITEFCGLKSKMYTLRFNNRRSVHKCKGIKYSSLKAFSHIDFVNCLHNRSTPEIKERSIRSFLHTLYNIETTKKIFHAYDDKRFILQNNIETLPFGHYAC